MMDSQAEIKIYYSKADAINDATQSLQKLSETFKVDDRFSGEKSEARLLAHIQLMNYFLDNVLNGDADHKLDAFDHYKSMCEQYDGELSIPDVGMPTEPFYIGLQLLLMQSMSKHTIGKLFEEVPKGMKVSVFESKFLDGHSPSEFEWMEKLAKSRLIMPFPTDGVEPKLIDAYAHSGEEFFKKISPLHELGQFLVRTDGWIEAEAVQKYDKGCVRLIDIQDYSRRRIISEDVIGFVIHDTDHELGIRRERELYPGRNVRVWNTQLEEWIDGEVSSDSWGIRKIRIDYVDPRRVTNFFGEETLLDFQYVYVGKNNNVDLGDGNFEAHPEMFPEIDMTNTATENPYSEVPSKFRPGSLLLFPSGEIGEITRLLRSGVPEIDIRTSSGKFEIDWENADQVTHLSDAFVSEPVMEDFIKRKLWRKVIRISGEPNFYKQIKGIYKINGLDQIILETLPVYVGSEANITEFRFENIEYRTFLQYVENGWFDLPRGSATQEIESRLPEFAEVRKNMSIKSAGVYCSVTLNGRMPSDKHIVYFHSLPWGVWVTRYRQPELIPVDRIESIQDIELELD